MHAAILSDEHLESPPAGSIISPAGRLLTCPYNVCTVRSDLRFEWDWQKAAANHAKHGIAFEEAATAFADEQGLLLDDPDHSLEEDRSVLLGLSAQAAASRRIALLPGSRFSDSADFRSEGQPDRTSPVRSPESMMRKQYDFRSARPNPYAKQIKRSITIRLDEPTIAYFKDMAEELELPYQTLINLYLRDCAAKGHRLSMTWRGSEGADE